MNNNLKSNKWEQKDISNIVLMLYEKVYVQKFHDFL